MKLSPSRVAAFEILCRIDARHEFSSSLLNDSELKLSDKDSRLCHELVLGTLRRQILLDRYIDALTQSRKLDAEVRIILRLALHQLYFLDKIPDHAIVNEAVGLTGRARKSSARGLVNAVLRSAIRKKPEVVFEDDLERLSIETSHPKWLLEKWSCQFGFERARDLAIANNQEPKLYFRKTPVSINTSMPLVGKKFDRVRGCYIAEAISVELRRLVEDGMIYIQDAGSQLVANAIDIDSGERFLDVCASPGGKTMAVVTNALSNDQQNIGFFAGDISSRRIKILADTIARQQGNSKIVQYDASVSMPFEESSFDHVLIDAPCTGTGTIRHNPEIRYFIQPSDFGRMQQTQIAILNNAADIVKKGGRLIYSTCSLEREENEDVCEHFMNERSNFRQLSPRIPERFVTKDGYGRTFPPHDDIDGFFIATFERI